MHASISWEVLHPDYTITFQEFRELWDKLDLVIDGGRITGDDHQGSRLGSTVVNLAEDGKFSIVRSGR